MHINTTVHLPSQDGELDDSSLISLSIPGDVAKKLLHYLKQKLPSSCLSDLLCSHAFCKHYLRRGGGCLEDEELLGEDRNTFFKIIPEHRKQKLQKHI